MRHPLVTDHALDVFPHLPRDRVAVGVGLDCLQDRQQTTADLPALTVCIDATEEDLLVGGTGHSHRVGRAVALLGRGADACGDPEAQEEAGDIVRKASTRRGVVHTSSTT